MKFFKDQSGTSFVEYFLLLVMVGTVFLMALPSIKNKLDGLYGFDEREYKPTEIEEIGPHKFKDGDKISFIGYHPLLIYNPNNKYSEALPKKFGKYFPRSLRANQYAINGKNPEVILKTQMAAKMPRRVKIFGIFRESCPLAGVEYSVEVVHYKNWFKD